MAKTEEILESIAPKNDRERLIFKEAIQNIVRKLDNQNKKMVDNNIPLFKANYKQRKGGDGFSNDREMRLVAVIPTEMATIAKKMYGDDVLTNKAKFREAFVKNEEGRYCLTVDPKSI